jgi:hypothetical protein
MVEVVGKTLVSGKPFSFEAEPWMMTKTLSHHFFERRPIVVSIS